MKAPLALSAEGIQRGDAQLAMTSMIDVVFLLLVFFVWTSSFDLPEQDLQSGVAKRFEANETGIGKPTPQPDPERSPTLVDEVVVRIIADGGQRSFLVGSQRMTSLAALTARFREIASLGVDVPVVIDPEPTTEMRLAIDVLDAVRQSGLRRVYFVASSE